LHWCSASASTAVVTTLFWRTEKHERQEEIRQLAQSRAEILSGQIMRSMEVLHASYLSSRRAAK
jgi:hypothetical protein